MAFNNLKNAFTLAPILCYFDLDYKIIVETNTLDYIFTGILSQQDDKGTLYPVAFFLKKHPPAKYNYEIYNKELIVII